MAEQTPSRPRRRQLSLFLPEAQRSIVEPIRQRLDPIQHGLIPAHVTLCREDELPDWQLLSQRLERLPPFRITMRFEEPQQLADGCVLLRPCLGADEFQALRQFILGRSARAYGAHLTLLHPRNATGTPANLAEMATELAGLVVTLSTVSLIEQFSSDPWLVRGTYGPAI
ncbi:MAG: 2'-5' RNA ligase family protein [Pseudomarimonas sp.]